MLTSMYRGKVTRANTNGVWVIIGSTWPGVELGPLDIVGTDTVSGGLADQIAQGDDVLVAETGPSDFIIIGTIRKGVSA